MPMIRHSILEWLGFVVAMVRGTTIHDQWLTAEQLRTVIAVASVAITGVGVFVSQQISVARLEEQMRAGVAQLQDQAMARKSIYEERFRQAELREDRHSKDDDVTEAELRRVSGVQMAALRDLESLNRRMLDAERKLERLQMYHQEKLK